MGKKSTPDPPDFRAAAEQTAAGNLENLNAQTEANRPDLYTPFGSSQWAQDSSGRWVNQIDLDPAAQESLDAQQAIGLGRSYLAGGMLDNVSEDFVNPMDWDQFGNYTKDLSSGADARQTATDASYGQATSRLDPRFGQRRQETEAKLRAQGLRPGDEAYDKMIGNLGRDENDAYNQAMFSSILTGGTEGQRDQSMDLTAGTFGNQVRQSQLTEEMQRRGFSLNELNALISGQQVGLPSMPGFNAAGVTPGADFSGAASSQYGAALDASNAEGAWMNSMLSGAGSLAMML